MKQLSYLDANFLYIETQHAPMHVGGTFIFNQPTDKEMTFARFKQHVQSRLQTSPVFRRRLIEIPLDLDLPYWLEDPHFDLEEHLFRHHLTSGTSSELQAQAEGFFSTPLDREKPLWEIQFVDGLKEAGDFAFIIKIHHCAIDGMSGEEILVGLLDFSEDVKALPVDNWEPEAFPRYRSLVGKKFSKSKNPVKQLFNLVKEAAETVNRSTNLRVSDAGDTPPLFFNSPATPFNVAVSGNRRLVHVHLPLKKIKDIKNSQSKVTVNDVVLAICSGALKSILEKENAFPDADLIAMIPISTRDKNAGSKKDCSTGNEVSAMLVSLETDETDALKRLEKIHVNSRKGIRYNRTVAAEKLLNQLPVMTSAAFTKAFTKLKASQILKPIYNVVITNVPGSPVPLYLGGAKLVSQSFNAPIYDYAGLTVNITSYENALTIGVTTTPEILPDGEAFVHTIKASFEALYQKAVVDKAVINKVTLKSQEEVALTMPLVANKVVVEKECEVMV
jgi:diacylglycerol O-acyltransferase